MRYDSKSHVTFNRNIRHNLSDLGLIIALSPLECSTMIELPPQLKYYYDKSLESFQHGHFVYAIEMSKAVIKQIPDYSPAYKLLYQSAQNLRKSKPRNIFSSLLSHLKVFYYKLSSSLHSITSHIDRAQWNYVQG